MEPSDFCGRVPRRFAAFTLLFLSAIGLARASDPGPPTPPSPPIAPGPPTTGEISPLEFKQAVQRLRFDLDSSQSMSLIRNLTRGMDASQLDMLKRSLRDNVDRLRDDTEMMSKLKDRTGLDPNRFMQEPEARQALLDLLKKLPTPHPMSEALAKRPAPPPPPAIRTPDREPPRSATRPNGGSFSPPLAPPGVEHDSMLETLRANEILRNHGFGDGLIPAPEMYTPPSPEQQRRDRAALTLSKVWERAVGPLDENPALRKALMEMVLAGEDIKGGDGGDLWKFLESNAHGSEGMGDLLQDLDGIESLGGDLKLPSMDLSWLRDLEWGGGNNRPDAPDNSPPPPRSPSEGRSGFGIPGFGGDSWWPVIVLAVLVVGGLIVWRFWEPRAATLDPLAVPEGFGPWPVDPRRLASRDDVVKAFEYVTVLRCGLEARMWNHVTIALMLGTFAEESQSSGPIARLYALARYAPVSEELSLRDLSEARRLVCHLAGVATA